MFQRKESDKIFKDLHVQRKRDEVYIQASRFEDYEKYGFHASLSYVISENTLVLKVLTTKGMISYYDFYNDGLVEAVVINIAEEHYRTKDDEEYFLKADRNLAAYKKILNFDEILPKELAKPDPTLGDLLKDI